jgi:hypothetical protein
MSAKIYKAEENCYDYKSEVLGQEIVTAWFQDPWDITPYAQLKVNLLFG